MMNMIDIIKIELRAVGGYRIQELDDLSIKIMFTNCILIISETYKNVWIKKTNYYNEVLEIRTYETLEDIIEYIEKNEN